MGNKIFTKFLYTGITTVLLSFVILASMLVMLTVRYSSNEREQTITAFGESIAEMTDLINGPYVSQQSLNIYAYNFSVIAECLNAQIIVTDAAGGLVLKSDNVELPSSDYRINAGIMNVVRSGQNYSGRNTLGGLFPTSRLNIGVPIRSTSGAVIGSVFISSVVTGEQMPYEMGKIFLISFMLVMLISIVMIYFSTRVLVRPLRQISEASKRFAKGDFSARINTETSGEVAELVDSFNNMAQSLSNLEEMRSSFIANVSHDLRTPMTTISGFVDGILDGTIPKEDQDRYLRIVSSEAKRLSRLVRTLLDISKMESGEYKLTISNFDMVESVQRTVLGFESRIEEKKIDLILDLPEEPLEVTGDNDGMVRVIYNLMDNAIKFCNTEGYIRVKLREENNFVEFRVRNSGAGLTKEKQERIFERFYKTDKSRGLDKSGLGLGLYIVKTIVEKHGGTISVYSEQGSYCEFVVGIPKMQPQIGGKKS